MALIFGPHEIGAVSSIVGGVRNRAVVAMSTLRIRRSVTSSVGLAKYSSPAITAQPLVSNASFTAFSQALML
jgi:hypothetical protein